MWGDVTLKQFPLLHAVPISADKFSSKVLKIQPVLILRYYERGSGGALQGATDNSIIIFKDLGLVVKSLDNLKKSLLEVLQQSLN